MMTAKPQTPYPWAKHTPLKVSTFKPLNPATLTQHQKQALWHGIQRDNPALAALLKDDPVLQELKSVFDGQIVFDTQEALAYMETKK